MSEATAVEWLCARCGETILDGKGTLWLTGEQGKAANAYVAWERERGQEVGGSAAQVLAATPPRGDWEVVCAECQREGEADASYYDIGLYRLTTHADVIAETVQLLSKRWIMGTNLDQTLRATLR